MSSLDPIRRERRRPVRAAGMRARRSGRIAVGLGLVCGVLGLLFPPVRAAETGTASIDPVRFVTGNGITVLVLERHALPIVQTHALVRAGSAQDPQDKAGLANLVALMLDEGTSARSANQLADAIDFVGGTLTTSVTEDSTAVAVKTLTKDLDLGLELLAEILLDPTFPAEELSRVQSHVLGEIKGEQEDPERVAMKAFRRLVFKNHPYRWPSNGTAGTIPTVTRTDLQRFYRQEYLPNQTILAVVGDVTVAQARDRITKYFGRWEQRPPARRNHPIPEAIRSPTVQLIDRPLTQSTIVVGHLGISRSNPDYYAVSVMNYILGAGGFSSRLMNSIRDRQGLAYGVWSAFEANLMPGAFMVSVQTRNEAANQAIEGVLDEIRGMREQEVSEEELADTKAYLIGSFPLRLDTASEAARALALVELYGLGLEYFTSYPKWIERVTRAEVLRATRAYLHPDRYVLVLVGNLSEAGVNVEGVRKRVDGNE